MTGTNSKLKVLLLCKDEEVRMWFINAVKNNGIDWRVRECFDTRIGAPEIQILKQDLVVLCWGYPESRSFDGVYERVPPGERSSEGLLNDIETHGGEGILHRTVILVRGDVARQDLVFFAEKGIKLVFPFPKKRSQWDAEVVDFLHRMERLHIDESRGGANDEEHCVRRFSHTLRIWSQISDESKMASSEALLKVLGDTARYAEMFAQRCIQENDFKGAEQWLLRSINKNPSYLKSFQLLAELYMSTGRHDQALGVLEKLKANSPRNVQRLTQIGKCYFEKGDFQKAEKVLEDALCVDEFYGDARDELGKVKFVQGDFEAARQLMATSENSKQLGIFLNKMGLKLVEQKRFAEAIEHYKLSQFVLPGNQQGHFLFFNISLAYAKWGKSAEALHFARLASIRDPNYEKAKLLIKRIEDSFSHAA